MFHLSLTLTLFILMDYLMHMDTISRESSILYFKGLQVNMSVPQVWFYLKKNSADPDEMTH